MTTKEFFETEWKTVSGFNWISSSIELESADGSEHIWISAKDLLSVVKKMYLQDEMKDEIKHAISTCYWC